MKNRIKKEKVIQDFRNELKIKNIENRDIYEDSFFKILNRLYKYHPEHIRLNINRVKNLTFLSILKHTYVYLEILNNDPNSVLLSINLMDETFDNCTIGANLSLDNALNKIDKLWESKNK